MGFFVPLNYNLTTDCSITSRNFGIEVTNERKKCFHRLVLDRLLRCATEVSFFTEKLMNRCQVSQKFYNDLISHIKLGDGLRKARLWVKRWKPTLDQGVLMFKGKPIIPKEDVHGIITHEITKNGAPLTSRDSLYKYLQQLYWGIKKNDCDMFLKKQEFYQLSKVRPAQHTRINKEKKEIIKL